MGSFDDSTKPDGGCWLLRCSNPFSQAAPVARLAHIDRLVVSRQDPDHDDSFLSEMEGIWRKRFDGIVLAWEGMVIDW